MLTADAQSGALARDRPPAQTVSVVVTLILLVIFRVIR